LPHIRLHPIAEPRIHADPAAERGQQIAPRTARARNPEHRLDKQPVVFAATPGVAGLPKTMRLHLRPLGVTQNESVHLKLESQPDSDVNPESKQTLDKPRNENPPSQLWLDVSARRRVVWREGGSMGGGADVLSLPADRGRGW